MTSITVAESRNRLSRNITPIPILVPKEEALGESSVDELTERMETLVNQTGELRVEVQDRPSKYNVQIRDLADDVYSLTEPVLILIEEYPGEDVAIASFPEIEVFGEGVTEAEAIQNLKYAIVDLYEELVESSLDTLGELPRSWLNVLERIIRRN